MASTKAKKDSKSAAKKAAKKTAAAAPKAAKKAAAPAKKSAAAPKPAKKAAAAPKPAKKAEAEPKAAKKSEAEATGNGALTLSTAALQHGDRAFGARFVKPGFAFTPEDDLAFALGYPYLAILADGHPDDADPAKAAPLYVSQHGLEPPVWPREVAHRMARAFGMLADQGERDEAFQKGGPVGETEARALVKRDMIESNAWLQLYLLEAMVGPSVIVDAVLGELESYTEEPWEDSGPQSRLELPGVILHLGYMLLRLPEAEAARARARLEALYAAWGKNDDWLQEKARDALDVVLHGKEGAERSAYKFDGKHISTGQPLHVLDDPAWIARVVREGGAPDESSTPDPRLVFLGGDDVLAREIGWWKKYTKPGAHAQLVARFGKIASPRILPWMLEMSATSKAKASATAWFVAHADHARPFLEKTAKEGGPSAAWAKAILPKLG
jgi:hypothetical protein